MRVSAISPISFQNLKMHNCGNIKLFDRFYHSVNNPEVPALSVDVCRFTPKREDSNNMYRIKFYNDDKATYDEVDEGAEAAFSCFEFVPHLKYIHVNMMSAKPENRGVGLGAALHLLNIVEMLENNDVEELTLTSTAKAMPFHIKFGFYPFGEYFRELKPNIQNIAELNDPELLEYSRRAKSLIESKIPDDRKNKPANALLYEFTCAALERKKDLKGFFTLYMPMRLTKEKVLQNKELYNAMFKKYDIDYTIK